MGEYINVVETFGCDVFNDSVMQARLLAPFMIIIIPAVIPVASMIIPTARLHAPVEDMVL